MSRAWRWRCPEEEGGRCGLSGRDVIIPGQVSPGVTQSVFVCDVTLQTSPAMDEVSPSSTSSFEMIDVESATPTYQMVQPHWFFCRRADDKDSWLPFSLEDSGKLEESLANGEDTHTITHNHHKLR